MFWSSIYNPHLRFIGVYQICVAKMQSDQINEELM
jgi:hypothetical protein